MVVEKGGAAHLDAWRTANNTEDLVKPTRPHFRAQRASVIAATLVAMVALTARAQAQEAQAQPLTKITIALPVLASVVMPLHYARDSGIFRKHGLEVDLPV